VSTRIIAIDGHGGAGKSTLAEHVSHAFGGATTVHTDDFASWNNALGWWPRLIDEVLKPIGVGKPARFKLSEWKPGHDRGWQEVNPADSRHGELRAAITAELRTLIEQAY
jgi:hypothetical protein